MGTFKIKNKKIFLGFFAFLIFLFFFSFINIAFAQDNDEPRWDRPLETDYIEIRGTRPETISFGLVEYFRYVFSFIIILSGLFALAGLIKGGIEYATSSGDPTKIKKARDQIIATFVGIIILLGSYIILYNISPELVIIRPIPVERFTYEWPDPPEPSPAREPTPFGRIAEIVATLITESRRIDALTERLDELIDECDCSYVWSSCICEDYYGECIGQYCWIGEDSHPCPQWPVILNIQRELLASRDRIGYYEERLRAELRDLSFQIEQTQEQIRYYQERINVEIGILEELQENPEENRIAIINQTRLIDRLENTFEVLNTELIILLMAQQQTQALIDLTEELISELTRLAEFDEELGYSLIDSCWRNVNEACDPECSGGCHNDICIPERCSGGNPCAELNTEYIRRLTNEIIQRSTLILEDLWDIDVPDEDYIPPGFELPDDPVLPPVEGSNFPRGSPVRSGGIVTSIWSTSRTVRGVTRPHGGIDISTPNRTPTGQIPIYATATGVATISRQINPDGTPAGYGLYVVIDHGNEVSTLYAHLYSVSVAPGDTVVRGQPIGLMGGQQSAPGSISEMSRNAGGSTGVHVHYEVRRGTTRLNINSGLDICETDPCRIGSRTRDW